ncbi:MAG: RNA 2',3'-cyclic phosphodiesterase [Candidatus Hodarchaeales archaeon]
MESNRLFVAVDIENEVCRETLAKLQSYLPSNFVKKPSKNRLHLTLKFLGDININLIPNIITSLERIEFNSFDLLFSETGAFPSKNKPRVLWIEISKGSKDLIELSNQINNLLFELNIEKESREFRAHLTLGRVKKSIPQPLHTLKEFFTYQYAEQEIANFISPVTIIFLKKSTLTPKGPIYEDIHIIKCK